MFFSPLILSGNDGSQFNHELDSHHCDHMGSQELEQTWTLGQGSTWMSLWKLGSMVSKWVYTWGFCWGYIPLILTIDPNFLGHPSTISAAEVGHGKNFSPVKIDRSLAGGSPIFEGNFSRDYGKPSCESLAPFFLAGKNQSSKCILEVQPATMFVFIVIRSGNQWLIEMKLVACEAFCEALCSIESTDSDSGQ